MCLWENNRNEKSFCSLKTDVADDVNRTANYPIYLNLTRRE